MAKISSDDRIDEDLPISKALLERGARVPGGTRKIVGRIGGRGTTPGVAKRNAALDGGLAGVLQALLDDVKAGKLPRKGSTRIDHQATLSWEVTPRGRLRRFSFELD